MRKKKDNKRILWTILCVNEFNKLDEIDTSLERHKLLKVTQEEINNLNILHQLKKLDL